MLRHKKLALPFIVVLWPAHGRGNVEECLVRVEKVRV